MKCWLLSVVLLAIGLITAPQVNTQASRPNIVVILADDLDANSTSTLLAKGKMPYLRDYVVNRGTSYEFTQAFATRASCCPSRATLLTGQYPHNHGVLTSTYSATPPFGGVTQFKDQHTLAVWLKAAGYQTGLVGKYMNGYGSDIAPEYIPPGWDYWQALPDPTTYRMYNFNLNDNGIIVVPTGYQTDVLAQRATNFIKASNSPFFLLVTPSAPHQALNPMYNECSTTGTPWEWGEPTPGSGYFGYTTYPAQRHLNTIFGDRTNFPLPQDQPSFNEEDVLDKPTWYQKASMSLEDIDCLEKNYWRRLESVLAVDDLIGKIVGALVTKGVSGNTVIIFSSDNGFILGEHRMLYKNPAWDESAKVPLYISLPGAGGHKILPQLVALNDIAPTISNMGAAEVTGITMDGRPLQPLFSNPTTINWRRRILISHWNSPDSPSASIPTFRAVRTVNPPYLYVQYPTSMEPINKEFYDLAIDPYALDNLPPDPTAAVLQGWIDLLSVCSGQSCQDAENNP